MGDRGLRPPFPFNSQRIHKLQSTSARPPPDLGGESYLSFFSESGSKGFDVAMKSFRPSGSVRSRPLMRFKPFFARYPVTTISVPIGNESLLNPLRNIAFGAPASISQLVIVPSGFFTSMVIQL